MPGYGYPYNITTTLFDHINAWSALPAIFIDILGDPALQNSCVVIDALDEWVSSIHSEFHNWPLVTERLDSAQISHISMKLNEAYVLEAVNGIMQHKSSRLGKCRHLYTIAGSYLNSLLTNNCG
ncbi:hypothetical protein N7507_010905 [Penicillium longicatenatum]|nr:hypothetical protein N7507_010905 [Penicillium longicatenatum]